MISDNIRIYITEACNAKCPNCFNRDNRSSNYMDYEHFCAICDILAKNGCSQIKIMGGEPTVHPEFGMFMERAQNQFATVSLFTNAISNKVRDFHPRQNDIITYNFKFRRLLTPEKLLLDFPGIRNLEIQITPSVIKEKLMDEIIRVVNYDIKRIRPYLTLDCTSNIFKYKSSIAKVYEYIWEQCLTKGISVGQDHLLPLCFIAGTKIPIPRSGSNCTTNCAGLIDAKYQLRFCNQYPDVLLNIFDQFDQPVSMKSISHAIEEKHLQIINEIQNKGCGHCQLFGILCNGGCFAGKAEIQELISVI